MIRVLWAQRQPEPGVLDTTAIDTVLARTAASGDPVRLRVTAGTDAPGG